MADHVARTVGNGADVHGPAGALLLLITGRVAALPQLAGDGLARLAPRLLPATPATPATD